MELQRHSSFHVPHDPSLHGTSMPLWPGREYANMQLFQATAPPMHRCAAMLIFRGGGYRINNGSGDGCAEFLASRGVMGIEVFYRTTEGPGACAVGSEGSLFPKPLHDAVRAIRLVRHKAREFNVDPNRIGVVGFSAGGHLAALLCGSELPYPEAEEEDLSHVSFRPDVCVLCYPLISLHSSLYGPGLEVCRNRLKLSEAEEEFLAADLRVARQHPPTFLWHTRNDNVVPVLQAETYAESLKEAGVAHESYFYDGVHGLGMALSGDDANDWSSKMMKWLGPWANPQLSVPAETL